MTVEGTQTVPDKTSDIPNVAGPGARSYAFILDWHIRILAAIVWAYGALFYLTLNPVATMVVFGLYFLPSLLIYFLYHPLIELFMDGSSPGKRYAGVRIVTLTGDTPTSSQILARNFWRVVDSLPLFYVVGIVHCINTKNQQRFGDKLAGTLLVYETATNVSTSTKLEAKGDAAIRSLLSRWTELAPDRRKALGLQLLAKLNHQLPDSENEVSAALHALIIDDSTNESADQSSN